MFQAQDLEDRLSAERSAWSRERSALNMQINEAEREASRLKNELRHSEILLEREREKYFTPQATTGTVDNDKVPIDCSLICVLACLAIESCIIF